MFHRFLCHKKVPLNFPGFSSPNVPPLVLAVLSSKGPSLVWNFFITKNLLLGFRFLTPKGPPFRLEEFSSPWVLLRFGRFSSAMVPPGFRRVFHSRIPLVFGKCLSPSVSPLVLKITLSLRGCPPFSIIGFFLLGFCIFFTKVSFFGFSGFRNPSAPYWVWKISLSPSIPP